MTVTLGDIREVGTEPVEVRIVAALMGGGEVVASAPSSNTENGVTKRTVTFRGIPRSKIRDVRVEARTYDWVTFSGIALRPSTQPIANPTSTQSGGNDGFRTLVSAPFVPGRSFRTTPNGEAVTFTAQTAPETDPTWTQGRQNVANAILQTHDTAPMDQKRRIVLIERDGTQHVLPCSSQTVGNNKQQALWKKAMGRSVRYGQFENRWQLCEVNFPKAWLPRLREVRLEAQAIK